MLSLPSRKEESGNASRAFPIPPRKGEGPDGVREGRYGLYRNLSGTAGMGIHARLKAVFETSIFFRDFASAGATRGFPIASGLFGRSV